MCIGVCRGQKTVLYNPGARGVVVMSHRLGILGAKFKSLEKDEGLCQSHKENTDGNDTT